MCECNIINSQSKEWLTQSLLSLMKTEPYHKITIKQICAHADLSRQTFYNFFKEKDDILRSYFKTKYEVLIKKYESLNELKIENMTNIFADFFESNNSFFKIMINQNLESILEDEISASILYFSSKIIKNIKCTPECNYVNAFLTGALTKTLIYWLKDNQSISKNELTELFHRLLTGTYYDLTI